MFAETVRLDGKIKIKLDKKRKRKLKKLLKKQKQTKTVKGAKGNKSAQLKDEEEKWKAGQRAVCVGVLIEKGF